MKFFIKLFLCAVSLFSCKEDDATDPNPDAIDVIGFSYTKIDKDFATIDAAITNALDAATPITVAAAVNHSNNAASVDLALDSTKVIIFGNPILGTPLMQANQLAGLDLPQKLFIWKNAAATVRVGFNNMSYFKNRYGLQDMEALTAIENALSNFATVISDDIITSNSATGLSDAEGIITKVSTRDFNDTYTALVTAIQENPNLRLVTEVNHQQNAMAANLELNPTRLIIFGNPNLGTPLMQNAQTTGIDLPQKFLVWENDNGEVMISYNDPAFLQMRHNITNNEDILATITGALNNLSNAAAGL